MEKKLKKIENLIYYFENGKKIIGKPDNIYGDLSGIRGDLSDIRGDVSDIRGDVSDCNITEEERKKGICVSDLICEEKGE